MTAKEELLKAVQELPDDTTWDDALERLFFLQKVHEGRKEAREVKGTPHEEIKRRYLR